MDWTEFVDCEEDRLYGCLPLFVHVDTSDWIKFEDEFGGHFMSPLLVAEYLAWRQIDDA